MGMWESPESNPREPLVRELCVGVGLRDDLGSRPSSMLPRFP